MSRFHDSFGMQFAAVLVMSVLIPAAIIVPVIYFGRNEPEIYYFDDVGVSIECLYYGNPFKSRFATKWRTTEEISETLYVPRAFETGVDGAEILIARLVKFGFLDDNQEGALRQQNSLCLKN